MIFILVILVPFCISSTRGKALAAEPRSSEVYSCKTTEVHTKFISKVHVIASLLFSTCETLRFSGGYHQLSLACNFLLFVKP